MLWSSACFVLRAIAMEIVFQILAGLAALTGLGCVCVGMYMTVARRLVGGSGNRQITRIDKIARSTIKLLHFGEISTPYPGLAIAFFGLFLFTTAAWFYFNYKKDQQIHDRRDPIMIGLANKLYDEFHRAVDNKPIPIARESFRRTEELIQLLLQIDQQNGHAIYYRGEVNRYAGDCKGSKEEFMRYLDVLDTLAASEKGGDISQQICYARARGYCRQRTGWIQYLLAHQIYWEALQETAVLVRKEKLKEALRQLDGSKNSFFPSTFSNIIPTAAFEATLNEQIRSLDTGGSANPIVPPNPCKTVN
jgi:hypothetical protein